MYVCMNIYLPYTLDSSDFVWKCSNLHFALYRTKFDNWRIELPKLEASIAKIFNKNWIVNLLLHVIRRNSYCSHNVHCVTDQCRQTASMGSLKIEKYFYYYYHNFFIIFGLWFESPVLWILDNIEFLQPTMFS